MGESGGDQHPNDLYHLSVTTLPTTVRLGRACSTTAYVPWRTSRALLLTHGSPAFTHADRSSPRIDFVVPASSRPAAAKTRSSALKVHLDPHAGRSTRDLDPVSAASRTSA